MRGWRRYSRTAHPISASSWACVGAAPARRRPRKSRSKQFVSRRSSNSLQLSQVVQVVPCHGLYYRRERHFAALGMVQFLLHIRRRHRFEQRKIPPARGRKLVERGVRVEDFIGFGPSVLIKRLEDVIG